MTQWPKPVSDDVVNRQRHYLKEKLGGKAAETYRGLLKVDDGTVKPSRQDRLDGTATRTQRGGAKPAA